MKGKHRKTFRYHTAIYDYLKDFRPKLELCPYNGVNSI